MKLKIGTRGSQLALWQANTVKALLAEQDIDSELVIIKSEGDTNQITPLYAMGVAGVFVRELDSALLAGAVDIAVHSMKDVPVQLAQGVRQAAVLERASPFDMLVANQPIDLSQYTDNQLHIGTSSIRRKAQWLQRFPQHEVTPIRGNVDTRLRKLYDKEYDAVIFAEAGLQRLGIVPTHSLRLDWMLPAPAQGAVMVVCRAADKNIFDAVKVINHALTATCVANERGFLHTLEGGCSAPISAYCFLAEEQLQFVGRVNTIGSEEYLEVEIQGELDQNDLGVIAAEILKQEEEV
jgi:hydroxymethylbilane synthase